METFLKDKKINIAVFVLLAVLSLLLVAKLVNEIRGSYYVGRGDQPSSVITVDGKGEVIAVSDIATLNINLNKDGATAKEAQELLNESVTKSLNYLKEKGIEDKDIKSEYGGLSPKYSYEKCYTYPCPTNQKITGYTATQSISVKIREVDSANDIRTGLAELGVTDINGPTFSIDNEDVLKADARSIAITDAKNKAEVLAKDLGVKLGKIISFNEGNNYYPMYSSVKAMYGAGDMIEERAAPVLPKGENKITSNITITYEIK